VAEVEVRKKLRECGSCLLKAQTFINEVGRATEAELREDWKGLGGFALLLDTSIDALAREGCISENTESKLRKNVGVLHESAGEKKPIPAPYIDAYSMFYESLGDMLVDIVTYCITTKKRR